MELSSDGWSLTWLQRGSCQALNNENVITPQRHIKMDLEVKVYVQPTSQNNGQIILLTFLEILGIPHNCKKATDTSPFGLLSFNGVGQRAISDLAQGSEQTGPARLLHSRLCLPNTSPAPHPLAHLACAAATAAEGARCSHRPRGSLPDRPAGPPPSAAGSKCPQRPAHCAAGPGGKEPSVAKGKEHQAVASCCFLEAVCASFPGP